ncbi:MAG: hypothetical protein ACI30H_08500 [Paludibacteraceae bacterium]
MKKIISLFFVVLFFSVKSFSDVTTYVAMDGTLFLSPLYGEDGSPHADGYHYNLCKLRKCSYKLYREKYVNKNDIKIYNDKLLNIENVVEFVGNDVSDEEINNYIDYKIKEYKDDFKNFLHERYNKNVDRIKRDLNYYISWEDFYKKMSPVFYDEFYVMYTYIDSMIIDYSIDYSISIYTFYIGYSSPGNRWWTQHGNEILLCYLRDEDEQKRIRYIMNTYEDYVENPHKFGLNKYSHDR